jgi:hypothetical protein
LTFEFTDKSGYFGAATIGVDGVSIHEYIGIAYSCPSPDYYCNDFLLEGRADFVTSSLVQKVVDVPAHTYYLYDTGQLTLTAEWIAPNGKRRTGTFSADVAKSFSSHSGQVAPHGVVIDVHECCAAFTPHNIDSLGLGPGVFSPRLARHLGVQQRTQGPSHGWLDLIIELIDGAPSSDTRTGVLYTGQVSIDAVAVPEPTAGVLGAIAAGALLRRKRAARVP